jgi:hydroxyethylthiazole kinase-like sugar kinase family protein
VKEVAKFSETLANAFKEHAVIFAETQETGDSQRGHDSSEVLLRIGKLLKRNRKEAREVIDQLMKSDNPAVLAACCVEAFLVKYREKEAEQVLEKIAASGLGTVSLNAEIILKLYRSGELYELDLEKASKHQS